jgi:ATP-dependent DNA helicase RecG
MKENGSPPPEFGTDGDRSYYLIRLPAHPKVESKESARADTKGKTSEKTSEKILTEIRNNRKCLSD